MVLGEPPASHPTASPCTENRTEAGGGEAANRSCSQGEVEEEGFMKLAELIESIVLST